LDAGGPVGAIESETGQAAIQLAVRVCAAPARKQAGLQIETRQVRSGKNTLLRFRGIHGGLMHLGEWMCDRDSCGLHRRHAFAERC